MFHNSKKQLRIETMTVYRNDVKITYSDVGRRKKSGSQIDGKKRQGKLSAKSIKNLAFYAQNTGVRFVSFVTLTYPSVYPRSGKVIKKHLNRFLSWLRGKFTKVSYLWFMEFQRRGAPHFHVMTSADLVPYRKDVSLFWYKAVGSEDKKHLAAGTNVQKLRSEDGCARYVAKYASKQYQKIVPVDFRDSGRFWGCSKDVRPEPVTEYNIRGMTGEELARFMSSMGWEYADSLTKPLTILYNAGKLF